MIFATLLAAIVAFYAGIIICNTSNIYAASVVADQAKERLDNSFSLSLLSVKPSSRSSSEAAQGYTGEGNNSPGFGHRKSRNGCPEDYNHGMPRLHYCSGCPEYPDG